MPKVLNQYNATQKELAEGVYCGRGSPWGNPFRMFSADQRDEVIKRFEEEVLPHLDVSSLRGKNLICFCAPKKCHCDSILKKANE